MNDLKKPYTFKNDMILFSKIVFNGIKRYKNVRVYSESDYIYVQTKGGKMVIYPKSSLTLAIPSIR